jgi:hypothetical protein
MTATPPAATLAIPPVAAAAAAASPPVGAVAEPPAGRPHWSPASLPSRLNREWRELATAPAAAAALSRWAAADPALAEAGSLEALVRQISRAEPARRDPMLLALLALAQDGDRLAGRVVLQVMLPKAVRVAMSIVRRPDVGGDREEAYATAVAALWQVIASYPIERRPRRVTANLALDTLAVVQRGHTGSSHFARVFPERPCADLRQVCEPVHHDPEPDELAGPADAELLMLLAWAVRTAVLPLDQARLLARAYGLDGQPTAGSAQVAAQYGLSPAALRQRCHRLARRLGAAAVAAGILPAGDSQAALLPAA